MAEPTPSPALPSTADATPYVPVSWAAVAALTVAVIFALTLLGFGYFAFVNKKPLLIEEVFVLPVLALVLSFTARRTIRDSEGTRTGERLAVIAWWLALILGLCYGAYLIAISYAIRSDAKREVEKWIGYINKGDDEGINRAFYLTLPPGARQGISPDDTTGMRGRFRDELLTFHNCDLAKLAQRNKGELKYTTKSVTWVYKTGAIECVVTGAVDCAEGSFPIVVQVKGIEGVTSAEGGGGRQWMIDRGGGGGFVEQRYATRTPYGWLVAILENSGDRFGKEFVTSVQPTQSGQPYAYLAYITEGKERDEWAEVARTPLLQLAFAVPAGITERDRFRDYLTNQFYKLPGGAEPTTDQKNRFVASWVTQGIRLAGDKLKGPDGGPIDKESLITITDNAVEVRMPIEIPLPGLSGKHEVARGRVLVTCTDPALLAELKQLKSEADPNRGSANPPEDMLRRPSVWRVVRIESDMVPINITPPRGPGSGPPPGGPGG